MHKTMAEFIKNYYESTLQTLRELCAISAPSHHEAARAEYCYQWLQKIGAKGAYIDEAQNVVFPFCCEGKNNIMVFAAHTDTVFPETEPLPFSEDEEVMRCPGVGDDTANVAVLLTMVRYFLENKITPSTGILFVCNSCEEGLGNLKGVRQLFNDYEGRIGGFVTFDGYLSSIKNECVGSHRYEVTVRTEGGHSYSKFGNSNAIIELSKIVTAINEIQVPALTGSRTTYNIGTINGGTSVNTIAQNASMLCEYRSTHRECLQYMKEQFEAVFEAARSEKVSVEVVQVGDRPCGNIEPAKQEAFLNRVFPALKSIIGDHLSCRSSSTDCNIPLSLGIPALCIGAVSGDGAHTREEWIEKSSLLKGLEVAITTGLLLTTEEEHNYV